MWLHLAAVLVGVAFGFWLMADDKLDSLHGKRVIVTGASGGVGEELAYQYAKYGATVVVTARRQEQLNKVVSKCQKLSPSNTSHKAIVADMKDVESIHTMVKKAVSHMGGLDILVLNHITHSDIATFTGSQRSLENFYNTIDVNFRSYVETAGAALPHLTESEGVLVVVNSLMGHVTNPKLAAYAASKHALNGFFDSLRSQFVMEERNVAVTSCVLGLIDTPNAMQGLKKSSSTRILRLVSPSPADGAALAIASASARRVDTVYYPAIYNRFCVILQKLFPSQVDFLMREMARS